MKAAAHAAFDVPHVDNVEAFVPHALLFIALSFFPAAMIFLAAPITRPTIEEPITARQIRVLLRFNVAISILLAGAVLLQRGSDAFADLYGNRLMVEHGVLGVVTIVMSAVIYSTATILALTPDQRFFAPVMTLCLIWGIFFAKGSMLAYPLLVYMVVRTVHRPRYAILGLVTALISISAVVLLGRLRAGGAVSQVFDDDGLALLLLLFLHRIDQLDSFALVLSQSQLEYTYSLWDEVLKSFAYLLPRGSSLLDKPLSFSMEMTQAFRPAVFEADAANNFTVFAQASLIAGPWGIVLCFLIFLGFFYSLAFMQRFLFPTTLGFWMFGFAIVVPSFMSLVGAGLFREYVLVQLLLSIPTQLALVHLIKPAGR
jgi:hypothetical protein